MGGLTHTEKILARHCVDGTPRVGEWVALCPRHLLTHDNSAAIMEHFAHTGAAGVRFPWQPLIALDHDVQNTDPVRLQTWREIEGFARTHALDFRPCGSGIGHEIMVAQGYVVPGSLCVAADSHANMYGALGALGTPVVRSEAAAIWATGRFWWRIPEVVAVHLEGRPGEGVTGKDLGLALCARYCAGEVHDRIVEFGGPGVAELAIEDRLTVANLTTEWGAAGCVFPADARTGAWMEGIRRQLGRRGRRRFTPAQASEWAGRPLQADADAVYAARITVGLDTLSSVAVGPESLHAALAAGQEVRVDKAFLVGCANARLADLRAAAEVVRGRRVHPDVQFYVAAASLEVQGDAVREGIWQTLIDAGARTLPPGCAMCIGLGEGTLRAGETAVSATNRNWPGRMGEPGAAAWLASPARVAQAAVDGVLVAASQGPVLRTEIVLRASTAAPPNPELIEGFPHSCSGTAVFLPPDNLDTDQLYPSTAVYRKVDRDSMAALVLQNYDPQLAAHIARREILIGGFNFGCGSSREQAVTALLAAGVRLVIAGSLARNFRGNAANNALLCVEAPELIDALQAQYTERSVDLPGLARADFATARVEIAGKSFDFERPAPRIQQLFLDGGLEAQVRRQFSLRPGAQP